MPSSPYGPWTTRKATSIDSARERTAARGGEVIVAGGARPASGRRACEGGRPPRSGSRRRRGRASERPVAELRGRALGQHPAPLSVDVDEIRLEAVAVDRAQHRLGRRDAHLVLCRAASGEDRRPRNRLMRCGSGQSPTNSISYAQLDAEPIRHRGSHVVAERADVGGAAAAIGDDEVRVERR